MDRVEHSVPHGDHRGIEREGLPLNGGWGIPAERSRIPDSSRPPERSREVWESPGIGKVPLFHVEQIIGCNPWL